ncbi:MAG TPA: cysteine desulfurase-like protein [Stellaceae bacterium]|nr:cysteine desulfurase-like protein [Stellaceae bacterium]
MPQWNIDEVRAAFPALAIRDDGRPRIYFDAPAGSQVPSRVLERMREAIIDSCANDGGAFRTSQGSDRLMNASLDGVAAFLGAARDEVLFGLNTTSLLFHFARLIARDWQPGDEIVLTRMDHDGNVAPWLTAAEERDVQVRWLDFDPESFEYRYDTLCDLIGPKTRFVACNHASNILGTINDVARIVAAAKSVGAVTMVDGVQSAPHIPIDVKAIGCDLFACSAYKFFGPHMGVLYLDPALRERLKPLKVRPSSWEMPWRFAPGTPSFEGQAGTLGAIEHLAWLGSAFGGAADEAPLRTRIVAGLTAATAHEAGLMRVALEGFASIPGLKVYGITGPNRLAARVPTFSFSLPGREAGAVAQALADRNIFAWSGNFYAWEAAARLGLGEGGVTRIGLAHYNSADEVRTFIAAIGEIAAGA